MSNAIELKSIDEAAIRILASSNVSDEAKNVIGVVRRLLEVVQRIDQDQEDSVRVS